MASKLLFHADTERLFGQVVQIFFNHLTAQSSGSSAIGVSGGRSITALLRMLSERVDGIVPALWRKLSFFLIDERVVPLDSEESNTRLLKEIFFETAIERGLIEPTQFVYPQLDKMELSKALIEVNSALESAGNRFDFVFAGVGEDGHIAGVFPSEGAVSDERIGFVEVFNAPKPPPHRLTVTPRLIAECPVVFAFFIGEEKRQALEKYLNPAAALADCPAKLIDNAALSYVITDIPLDWGRAGSLEAI